METITTEVTLSEKPMTRQLYQKRYCWKLYPMTPTLMASLTDPSETIWGEGICRMVHRFELSLTGSAPHSVNVKDET